MPCADSSRHPHGKATTRRCKLVPSFMMVLQSVIDLTAIVPKILQYLLLALPHSAVLQYLLLALPHSAAPCYSKHSAPTPDGPLAAHCVKDRTRRSLTFGGEDHIAPMIVVAPYQLK
jgi:hypothetical protein